MQINNRDIVIDLRHHKTCSGTPQQMVSRLTKGVKISDMLQSLGGAESIEIRFHPCPNVGESSAEGGTLFLKS